MLPVRLLACLCSSQSLLSCRRSLLLRLRSAYFDIFHWSSNFVPPGHEENLCLLHTLKPRFGHLTSKTLCFLG